MIIQKICLATLTAFVVAFVVELAIYRFIFNDRSVESIVVCISGAIACGLSVVIMAGRTRKSNL